MLKCFGSFPIKGGQSVTIKFTNLTEQKVEGKSVKVTISLQVISGILLTWEEFR
jgi:hypothetical protein